MQKYHLKGNPCSFCDFLLSSIFSSPSNLQVHRSIHQHTGETHCHYIRCNMNGVAKDDLASLSIGARKPENQKNHVSRDIMSGRELWINGLICAFEFVRGGRKISEKKVSKCEHVKSLPQKVSSNDMHKSLPEAKSAVIITDRFVYKGRSANNLNGKQNSLPRSYWIPIGWARIYELVQTVEVDAGWPLQPSDFPDEEDDVTVADLAAPYWERPVGPTWWCHVDASHPYVNAYGCILLSVSLYEMKVSS